MTPKPKKDKSSKEEKLIEHKKVTPEDLYKWISSAFEKLETNEGITNIKNTWKGCGYEPNNN